ncbi:MAG: ribonuclease, partial [Solirubrobacteraceae bacterium]|nr:ribonuclease [Solirubrobacteraceae bacterium]
MSNPQPSTESIDLPSLVVEQAELDALCARLAADEVIGVDTEYLTDRRFFPELCLIQVGSDREQALIDPLADLNLDPLADLLGPGGPVVVMHNAQADVPLLARATGRPLGPVFDTMLGAGFLGAGELSLSAVVQRFLGITMEKGATLTDWSRRPLPEHALTYAVDDVAYLPELWRRLATQLEAQGRMQWASDEVGRVLARAMEPPDLSTAWRRL